MPETITGSIYDFPKYYDLIFNADWATEVKFLEQCFHIHSAREVRRVFEPACGTGRLLAKLARRGFECSGNDLNPVAVKYCNARLKRLKLPESVVVADMSNFKLRPRCDAAFNLINTFRHLPDEATAEGHLRCMADALNPGGIYLLGLHLLPTRGVRMDDESWSGKRGQTKVKSYMWTKKLDRAGRMEHLGMNIDVVTPTKTFQIRDEMHYRTYTAAQMQSLLERTGVFSVQATYDFLCRPNHPIEVDELTQDVIYVLKKQGR